MTQYTTKVIRSILQVVVFHFVCWTPFWIFVLLPMLGYFDIIRLDFLNSEHAQTIRMISRYLLTKLLINIFLSFLPYLNSAGNWIFYAAMNRELRETVTIVRRRTRVITELPNLKQKTFQILNSKSLWHFILQKRKVSNTSKSSNENSIDNL